MPDKPYVPKLCIEITDEQNRRMQNLLPHGSRKLLFGIVIDDLLDLIEENGPAVLGAMMARAVTLRHTKTIGPALHAIGKDEDKHTGDDT